MEIDNVFILNILMLHLPKITWKPQVMTVQKESKETKLKV